MGRGAGRGLTDEEHGADGNLAVAHGDQAGVAAGDLDAVADAIRCSDRAAGEVAVRFALTQAVLSPRDVLLVAHSRGQRPPDAGDR